MIGQKYWTKGQVDTFILEFEASFQTKTIVRVLKKVYLMHLPSVFVGEYIR